jgi:hypothetical protein
MARNTKPDYKSVTCEFDVQKDFERTKPNLGLTPQQVATLVKRSVESQSLAWSKLNLAC